MAGFWDETVTDEAAPQPLADYVSPGLIGILWHCREIWWRRRWFSLNGTKDTPIWQAAPMLDGSSAPLADPRITAPETEAAPPVNNHRRFGRRLAVSVAGHSTNGSDMATESSDPLTFTTAASPDAMLGLWTAWLESAPKRAGNVPNVATWHFARIYWAQTCWTRAPSSLAQC
jgi:hypothetical protein